MESYTGQNQRIRELSLAVASKHRRVNRLRNDVALDPGREAQNGPAIDALEAEIAELIRQMRLALT